MTFSMLFKDTVLLCYKTKMKPKRIIRSSKNAIPPSEKVSLERILGFTIHSNACLDTSSDGTLAYPAGCVVVLYNAKKTKQSHIFNVSKKTITSLAFSADGKHLVTGESGHQPAVRVWELDTCSQVTEFLGHKFGISCVAFSPNLKYIISVGTQHDMTVNVWNWKSNCKIASNKVTSKVADVAFSEDGSRFVTVGVRHVKFWSLDSTKSRINETVPLQGRAGLLGDHKNNTFCGVCCGKGVMEKSTFVITRSGLLIEFNERRHMDKWVELRTASASCLAVTESHIMIGCADGVVRIFSSKTLHYITSLPRPHFLGVDVAAGHDQSHMKAALPENARYPDTIGITYDQLQQKVTCVYSDHSMYVWDVQDVKRVGKSKSFLYHSGSIWGLEVYPKAPEDAVLPEGSFITCGADDTIRIWNVNQGIGHNTAYKRNIYSFELLRIIYTDPELQYLCEKDSTTGGGKSDKGGGGGDATTEKNGIRSVRVSPDGRHLASGDRTGNIRVHELTRGGEQQQFIEAHDTEVLCLEFTDPYTTGVNFMASSSRDRLLHVFDRDQDYGLVQTLDDHSAAVTSVKFAKHDGQLHMLSCGVDKSLLFRNAVMDPQFQFVLNRNLMVKTSLYDMDVDPTAKFVATACQDRLVRIYNVANGKQKTCYSGSVGSDGTLLRIELDSSGQLVASSCSNKNIAILDFFTGELLANMFGHSEVVTGVKFMHDMRHLISVSGDGCIFIWRLPQDFAKNVETRRMKIADPALIANGENAAAVAANNLRRGTFNIPKAHSTQFVHHDVTDSMPPLSELRVDGNANVADAEKSPDYRFSIGQLPGWAKNRWLQEPLKSTPGAPGASVPSGAWAKKVGGGSSVPIKAADDSDIHLSLADCMGKIKPKRDKRRFTVEADTLTKQLKQLDDSKQRVSVIRDDDQNNRDDNDDGEFVAMTADELEDELAEGDAESIDMDNTRVNMFRGLLRKESHAEFDLPDEAEQADVIYIDDMDSPDSVTSSFRVFEDVTAGKEIKKPKRRPPMVGVHPTISGSEGTEAPSLDDVSDDENEVTSPDTTKSFVSTPDQEKFVHDNFLKMEMFAEDANSMAQFNHRSSISAKFLTRGQQMQLKQQVTLPPRGGGGGAALRRKDDMTMSKVEETKRKLQAATNKKPLSKAGILPSRFVVEKKDAAGGRRAGSGVQRRKPEPGSDRRKTIGDTTSVRAAEQRFRSPISSPVPGSFGTPERRRWGPDSTATTSSGLNRKWSSMLDVQGGQSPGKASGRITPRSRTPTTYRNTAGRLLPQPPAAAAAELGRANASKTDGMLGGGLSRSAQSRSERNLMAAVEADDKRKSSDNTPSYLRQTSSSTAKLSRAKSNLGLTAVRDDADTTGGTSARSVNASNVPADTTTAAKGAAARRSAAARRERLNAGMKSKFKSSPNLLDAPALTPRDNSADDAVMSRENDADVQAARPTSAFSPRSDDGTFGGSSSRDAHNRLAMPPPPQVSRVPKSNTFSGGLTFNAADDEPQAFDVDELNATSAVTSQGDHTPLSGSQSVTPRSDANSTPTSSASTNSTAFIRRIYEANMTNYSPATARTMSEINDVVKAQTAAAAAAGALSPAVSPWHSSRSSAAAQLSARSEPGSSSTASPASARRSGVGAGADLRRSDSSGSLDETPVKEERRSKVEMTNIRLSSPAPSVPPSAPSVHNQPPPLPSQPPPPPSSGDSVKPSPLQKHGTEPWQRTARSTAALFSGGGGGDSDRFTLKAPERPALRRREGEPEDVPSTSRLFLAPQASSSDGSDSSSQRPYSRPRSSIEASDRSESAVSPRFPETSPAEGRVRTGTLLSRNKELLTNLLTTHKGAAYGAELVSSSPQVPRRHRGASLGGTGGPLAGKLQWMKQTPVKHPLDVAGASASSASSSTAVTSPRSSVGALSAVQSPPELSPKPTTSVLSSGSGSTLTTTLRSMAPPAATQSDSSITSANTTTATTVSSSTQSDSSLSSKVVTDPPEVTTDRTRLGSQSSAFRSPRTRPVISLQEPTPPQPAGHKPTSSPRSAVEEAKPDRTDLKLDLKKNEPTVASKEPTKEVLREFDLHMDKLMTILKENPQLSGEFSKKLCSLAESEISERVEKLVEKRLCDVKTELEAQVKACVTEALAKQSYV